MKNERKFDARPKVIGTHKFVDDYHYDGMIYGALIYSKVHHGKIRKITYPNDFKLSEFTIVKLEDIPGKILIPEPETDQPFFADKEVFFYGQIILAVAHPNKNILNNFVKKIKIEYEELSAITDIKETLDNKENTFGKQIIIDHRRNVKVEKNWLKTHSVYYTPHQEQAYLETQAMIAKYDEQNEEMFILGTMQCPFFVKEAVETILGDKIKSVQVETSEGIGGGFGGKEDFPNLLAGITALLSFKSKLPVKIVLDRSDDITITTKRHPARIEVETYTDPQTNKIRKMNVDYRLDAGFYQTLSPVVLSRGVLHASGGYNIEDVYIHGRLIRSNTPPNGAFRGFGAPQAFFAIESHIEKIASELKIESYQFRKIDIFRKGDEFPSTQKISEDNLFDCFESIVEKSDYLTKYEKYKKFNQTHKDKLGIGLAIGYHGGGYTGNGEKVLDSEIKIKIDKKAIVTIYISNVDMGQGAHTTLAQLFSETIDHPFELTNVHIPNTKICPNSGPTVASRTIYIVGNMVSDLARKIKKDFGFDNLKNFVKQNKQIFPKEFSAKYKPDPNISFDENTYQGTGYKDYSWAACAVELYYHADTYQIELLNCWSMLDIGHVVNPKIAVGQAEGGVLQALAYGSSEFFYKKGFGRMHGFTDYTLPTTMDIPKLFIDFIHTDNEIAKGLGEVPMDYPAPAVRNAFFNATGIFIDEIPLIPETIFHAMKKEKKL